MFLKASAYVRPGLAEKESEWCLRSHVATTPLTANIAWIAWEKSPEGFDAEEKPGLLCLSDSHRKRGLFLGVSVKPFVDWRQMPPMEEMLARIQHQLDWLYENRILREEDEESVVYVDSELCLFQLTTIESQYTWALDSYASFIQEIRDRVPERQRLVVVWSPYISQISSDPKSFADRYAGWLQALTERIQARERKITLVSAVQDGVGCVGHPSYPETWGKRRPGEEGYPALLGLLKAHKAACKRSGVVGRVNAELFQYDPDQKNWTFGPMDRLDQQFQMESHFSMKGPGPCWILTDKGMGDLYDNEEFVSP